MEKVIKRNELGYEVLVPESDKYGIGKRFINREGCPFEIVDRCSDNRTYRYIVFLDDYGAEIRANISDIKKGRVKNPYFPSIEGAGFVGVGKYKQTVDGVITREANLHRWMLRRVFSKKYQETRPTYKNVEVDDKLLNFQYFCGIVNKYPFWNMKDENNEYYQMDKDIFSVKRYDESTIVFVPREINMFFANIQSKESKYAVGVNYYENKRLYVAQISGKYIGAFRTEIEAYECYCNARNKRAKELAQKYYGKIEIRVYDVLMNYDEMRRTGYSCRSLVEKLEKESKKVIEA